MLYRKVLTKDREPDYQDVFDTDLGKIPFIPDTMVWINFKDPDWWMEPIQEPTEEEISEKAKRDLQYQSISVKVHHDVGFRIGFYSGYKQALKDLKGE